MATFQKIVLDNGDYWIEQIFVDHGNIGAGLTSEIDITLLKAGHVIGITDSTSFANPTLSHTITKFGVATPLTESDMLNQFSGFRSRVFNPLGSNVDARHSVLVHMRK